MALYLASAMRSAFPARRLVRLLPGSWQSAIQELLHPYHPERHYMRGPGPAWHAKHPAA